MLFQQGAGANIGYNMRHVHFFTTLRAFGVFFGSETIIVIVVSIAIHIVIVGGTTIGSIIAVASAKVAGSWTVPSGGCHIIVSMTIIGRRGS